MRTDMYRVIKYDGRYENDLKTGIFFPIKYFNQFTNRHFVIRILSLFKLYRNYLYLLIAPDGIEVLGCLVVRYRINRKSIKRNWWIYGVFIKENQRGKGLGKLLMDKAIEFMISNNANSIFLYVEKENKPAINLYNKYGFKIIEKSLDHKIKKYYYLMKKEL